MIVLDYTDRRPIYEQVIERIQDLIYKGILESDEKLPSVRSLAMELSINPNTIQRAYSELEKNGFIYSIKGKGNFVAADHRLFEKRKAELMERLEPVLREARDAGITQREVLAIVEKIYDSSDTTTEGGKE